MSNLQEFYDTENVKLMFTFGESNFFHILKVVQYTLFVILLIVMTVVNISDLNYNKVITKFLAFVFFLLAILKAYAIIPNIVFNDDTYWGNMKQVIILYLKFLVYFIVELFALFFFFTFLYLYLSCIDNEPKLENKLLKGIYTAFRYIGKSAFLKDPKLPDDKEEDLELMKELKDKKFDNISGIVDPKLLFEFWREGFKINPKWFVAAIGILLFILFLSFFKRQQSLQELFTKEKPESQETTFVKYSVPFLLCTFATVITILLIIGFGYLNQSK